MEVFIGRSYDINEFQRIVIRQQLDALNYSVDIYNRTGVGFAAYNAIICFDELKKMLGVKGRKKLIIR